jgi:hypothetical protein
MHELGQACCPECVMTEGAEKHLTCYPERGEESRLKLRDASEDVSMTGREFFNALAARV